MAEEEQEKSKPKPLVLGLQKLWTSIKEKRAADKIMAAAVTASVAAVAAGGYYVADQRDKLEKRVSAVESQRQPDLKPLQADVAKLSKSVTSLAGQSRELSKALSAKTTGPTPVPVSRVNEIAQTLAGTTTELAKLSGRLEQTASMSQGAVADNAREISQLATLVSTQSGALLEGLATTSTSAAETGQKVAALTGKLAALSASLEATSKALTTVNATLVKQQTLLDAQAAALGAVRTTLAPLPTAVSSLQAQVSPLPGQISSLQGTIDAVGSFAPIAIGKPCCIRVEEGKTIDQVMARVKTEEGSYLLSIGGGDNYNCNGGTISVLVDDKVVGQLVDSYGNCRSNSIALPPVHLTGGEHDIGVRLPCISGNGACGYAAWGTLQRTRP